MGARHQKFLPIARRLQIEKGEHIELTNGDVYQSVQTRKSDVFSLD